MLEGTLVGERRETISAILAAKVANLSCNGPHRRVRSIGRVSGFQVFLGLNTIEDFLKHYSSISAKYSTTYRQTKLLLDTFAADSSRDTSGMTAFSGTLADRRGRTVY
jgi:hypothetical protein